MEVVNNLETILEKQDEVAGNVETEKAVEAAVSGNSTEIEKRIAKWRCTSCGRGFKDCHCRLIVEAQGIGRPHGRRAPHGPDQVSRRAASRRKARRKMQKRSRRINRCR